MKITMYELLGMIKDGKASDITTNFMFDRKKYNLLGFLDKYTLDINALNWEVEILEEKKAHTLNDIRESYGLPRIEEKKIPEKLSTWFSVEAKQSKELNIEYANTNFENMYEKINEICDYLKNKGE